jgi:hypothetical protein
VPIDGRGEWSLLQAFQRGLELLPKQGRRRGSIGARLLGSKRLRRCAGGSASALRTNASDELVLAQCLPTLHLRARAVDGRMQSRAIRLVEVVLLMREHQVDLAAFRQVDRLIKDEPATTNPGAERQRHASQDSIARHEALRSRAIAYQGERILLGLICGQRGLQELEQVSVAPGGELALGLDALLVSPFAFGQVHRDLAEQREVFGAMVGSDA